MVLAPQRKISILIIGTFLIGIIIGLFFARVQEERKGNERFAFTTQSIGGEEMPVQVKEIICPREDEIRRGETVVLHNPLVEKAHELFSLQQGIISKNYILWGPPSSSKDVWKGQLVQRTIDNVTAGVEKNTGWCVYSSLGKDVAMLRQDTLGDDCEAVNTSSFVGFSCRE